MAATGSPTTGGTGQKSDRVAAVVVDYYAGTVLADCINSLLSEGVGQVVVVENGDPEAAREVLRDAGLAVPLVVTGRNVGYGAGANRGFAAAAPSDFVLVCNPDLHVHEGALRALQAALDAEPAWAVVGPRILTPTGEVYPSVRHFPSMLDAAGHALIGLWWPDNPFSRRYKPAPEADGIAGEVPRRVDWISGACFLARRAALEELGGFDEAYFMFAEEVDLCWRARQRGWGVGIQPAAVVTHAEGLSRRRRPYRMLVAHHRSAFRFAARSARGWRRAAVPLAAVVLGARLVMACVEQAVRDRAGG